jgi:hypothetical protein
MNEKIEAVGAAVCMNFIPKRMFKHSFFDTSCNDVSKYKKKLRIVDYLKEPVSVAIPTNCSM